MKKNLNAPKGIMLFVLTLSIALGFTWLLGSSAGNQALLKWAGTGIVQIGSFSGSLWGEMQLNNVHYQDEQQELTIESLNLHWQPLALIDRLLHVTHLQIKGIKYRTSRSQDSESSSSLQLPLNIRLDHVSLKQLNLAQNDQVTDVDSITLKAKSHDDMISLTDIKVQYQQHLINAVAQISLQPNFTLTTTINWQGEIPELGLVSARAELQGDLNTMQTRLIISNPASLAMEGSINFKPDAPVLSLRGHWQQLQWPIHEQAEFISETGKFTLNGVWGDLAISIDTGLRMSRLALPVLQTKLTGSLTGNGIENLALQLKHPGGKLTADGWLGWSSGFHADMSIHGKNIDPSVFHAGFPGDLNFESHISGGLKQGNLWLNTDIKELAGTLRGYPVKASGQARYAHDSLTVNELVIVSGPNQLNLKGEISEQFDLQYAINATDLSASWPEFTGELVAKGHLSGNINNPSVTTTLKATRLEYQDNRAGVINAELNWLNEEASGDIQLKDFSLAGFDGKALSITISGTPRAHDVEVLLNSTALQIQAIAQGNWQTPQWRGHLAILEIDQYTLGRWKNTGPVNLLASSDQVVLEKSCLMQDEAVFCGKLKWQDQVSTIEASLTGLPLKKLLKRQQQDVEIDGDINVEVSLKGPLERLQGEALIALPSGRIVLQTDKEALPLQLRDGKAHLKISPSVNSADLHLIAGLADINAQLKSGPLAKGLKSSITGKVNARIPELSDISVFVPGITDITGSLQAQASISGTFEKPDINGFMELQNASAIIPQLGIELENTNLTARNSDAETITFQGETTSGDGRLGFDGTLLLQQSEGWPMQVKLSGQNIQVARLPEAQVTASPDLNISLKGREINISGKVSVPSANIELMELPRQAVTVSQDEVILGQHVATQETLSSSISTNIDLNLGSQVSFKGFGLNTRIQGDINLYTLEGKNLAQGQLLLKDGKYKAYGQNLTIEKGLLLFKGTPHNPDLDIKATRLSQDKSVTAILNVSGNLQKPLVTLSSTPSLPEEEALYYLLTGKGLGDEGPDRIAMLRMAAATKGLDKSQEILDRIATDTGLDDVNIQEGKTLEDTSLLLGKYLSPDLYVSYAVGLFDNQGALMTRYRINKRLRMEVTSGDSQSMDIIYSIEK